MGATDYFDAFEENDFVMFENQQSALEWYRE
jgi:hypothetical protein